MTEETKMREKVFANHLILFVLICFTPQKYDLKGVWRTFWIHFFRKISSNWKLHAKYLTFIIKSAVLVTSQSGITKTSDSQFLIPTSGVCRKQNPFTCRDFLDFSGLWSPNPSTVLVVVPNHWSSNPHLCVSTTPQPVGRSHPSSAQNQSGGRRKKAILEQINR